MITTTWHDKLRAVGVSMRGRSGDVVGKAVWALRDALYRDDAVTAAQWIRLGRLLEAVVGTAGPGSMGYSSVRAGLPERLPGWLYALVMDVAGTISKDVMAVWSAGRAQPWESSLRLKWMRAARPHWDAGRLEKLLEEAGIAQEERPVVVLLLVLLGEERYARAWRPTDLPGIEEYAAECMGRVPVSLPEDLTIDRRSALLAQLKDRPAALAAGAPLVAAMCTDTSKVVRREAVALLDGLEPQLRAQVLEPVLARVPASRAAEVLEFLAGAEGGAALLARAVEENPRLAEMIGLLRRRRDMLVDDGPIEIPPFRPLEAGPSAAAAGRELRAYMDQLAGASETSMFRDMAKKARRTTDADVEEFVAAADGRGQRLPVVLNRFPLNRILSRLPSLTLMHVCRLLALDTHPEYFAVMQRVGEDADPRAVFDLMGKAGVDRHDAEEHLAGWMLNYVAPEASWPWFAENPELLHSRLTDDGYTADTLRRVMEVLAHFPRIPAELLPVLGDMAVGDSKVARPLAQRALRSQPRVRALAEQALGNKKMAVRASAAAWVGSLGDPASSPVLREVLLKEKREVVRAALLTALSNCGGDMDEFLSPQALAAMADKGLLAFAVRMEDADLAAVVRAYMRDNPGRRAQFEALVHVLYANSGPQSLQLLLGIAQGDTGGSAAGPRRRPWSRKSLPSGGGAPRSWRIAPSRRRVSTTTGCCTWTTGIGSSWGGWPPISPFDSSTRTASPSDRCPGLGRAMTRGGSRRPVSV